MVCCHATHMHNVMACLPTGMDKYYLGLEKGLEKVRIVVSVELWEYITSWEYNMLIFEWQYNNIYINVGKYPPPLG